MREKVVHRVSSSLLGPVLTSFRVLSGRRKFTVRRHKFNKDSLFLLLCGVSNPAEVVDFKTMWKMLARAVDTGHSN